MKDEKKLSIIASFSTTGCFILALLQLVGEPITFQTYVPQMSVIGEVENVLTTINLYHLSLFITVILLFTTVTFILYNKKKIFR